MFHQHVFVILLRNFDVSPRANVKEHTWHLIEWCHTIGRRGSSSRSLVGCSQQRQDKVSGGRRQLGAERRNPMDRPAVVGQEAHGKHVLIWG